MDAHELRDRQRSVSRRYRDDPAQARIPARAVADVDQGTVSCRVTSDAGSVVAGLHTAAGGEGGDACSADLLLGSLAACAGVTLAAVASSMGIVLDHARVIAEGHWDARGTLGLDPVVRVGLIDITLAIEVQTDAPDDAVDRLMRLTERHCVIAQTLADPPTVVFAGQRAVVR